MKYLKVRFNVGKFGEYLTYRELEKIKESHAILTNIYIPKTNEETTEIDLIYIHETGIYVVESKNYSGWIFGSEKNKYWTQIFKTGRKERFYNPIWQNNTHIRHLSEVMNYIGKNQFKSIIVFSERCTLKKIEVYSDNIKVVKRNVLNKVINKFISESSVVLKEEQIKSIYESLKAYSNVSEEIKRRHIERIRSYRID